MSKFNNGFTLVEILLVIALFTLVLGLTAPLVLSSIFSNDLETSTELIAQSLRRAKTMASAVSNDSEWGVSIQNHTLVIFAGNSFNARDTGLDENVVLPATITVSGNTEIVFSKLLGEPAAPAWIYASNPLHQNETIAVNSAGTVSY